MIFWEYRQGKEFCQCEKGLHLSQLIVILSLFMCNFIIGFFHLLRLWLKGSSCYYNCIEEAPYFSMGEGMSGWLGFSLLAMGLWGTWGMLSKWASHHLPPLTVYVLTVSGHAVVLIYLWASGKVAIPWNPQGIGAALAAGLCMAFGLLFFFQALARGEAAVVVPFTALYPLITVILAWLVLKEDLGLRQLAGITLALGAVWLLSR